MSEEEEVGEVFYIPITLSVYELEGRMMAVYKGVEDLVRWH